MNQIAHRSSPPPASRPFAVALILAFILVDTLVALGLMQSVLDDRTQREQEVRTRLGNLAMVVDQTIAGEIREIELMLREVSEHVALIQAEERENGRGAKSAATPVPMPLPGERLRHLLTTREAWLGKGVRLEARLTPPGEVQPDTGGLDGVGPRKPPVQLHLPDPKLPERERLVTFSLPYYTADARPAGEIVATLPVSYFTRVFGGLDLGAQGVAILRDDAHDLVLRVPPSPALDQQPGTRRYSRELQDIFDLGVASATYHTDAAADGLERTLAYRHMSNLPLHLVLGMGASDYLEEWQHNAIRAAVFGALFLLLTAGSGIFLWRQYQRTARDHSLLRSLMNTIPDLVWLKDVNGRYITCNPRFEVFYGAREGELVGQDDFQFVDKELAEFFRQNDRLALEGGKPRTNEEWLTFADGSYRGLFETVKTPMLGPDGKPIGVLGIARDITRLKEATKALAVREEIFRSIVSQAADGIVLLEAETATFTEFNDAACTIAGRDRETLAKTTLFDLLADRPRADVQARIDAVLEQGEGNYEVHLIRPDGSQRAVLVSNRAVWLRGKSYIASIWHDITARSAAEEALRAERQVRETIMESVPGVIYAFRRNGELVFWNRNLEEVTGRHREELQTTKVLEFFEGADRDLVTQRIQAVFETGRGDAEASLITRDGQAIPYYFSGRAVTLGGETLLVGAGVDLRARREAEQALRQLNNELEMRVAERTADLQAAHQQLLDTESAMEAVGIGITWVTVPEGRFVYTNHYFAEALGYTREELLTLTVPDIDPNFPVLEFTDMVGQIRARGHLQFETTHRRRNGSLIPVEMTVFYNPGEEGESDRLIAFSVDISRRKQAETALREAKEASEAANAAKSAFLANMSHEIRTPLNAILGLTYLLRRDGLTDPQTERLDKIEISGRHLLSVINDILDLSKIEAGRLEIDTTDFHLSAVLDNVASIIRDSARSKGLSLEVDPDHVPLWLRGDVTRLRQALLNFAGNAVKFTERGEIALRALRLAENADGSLRVRFEVSDTGIGILPEHRARLFEPFQQADGSISRKFGGTGLGLALTKRLVELMGGEVGVTSTPGEGSTFWFAVPLERGHGPIPELPVQAVVSAVEARLRQRHQGQRILMAEDNPVNVEVVGEMLHAVGLDVAVANDGRRALELAQANTFDLVLMDMQMPVMDGIEATRALRQLPHYGGTPIVALTANAFAEDRAACLDAGMNDTLTKPVDPAHLYETLLHWLSPDREGPPPQQPQQSPAPPAPLAARLSPRPPATMNQPATQDPYAPIIARLEAVHGVDLARGLHLLRGKTDKYLDMVRLFLSTHGNDVAALQTALNACEWEKARHVAHAAKGSAATLGLTAVAENAALIDQALRQAGPEGPRPGALAEPLAELTTALRELSAAVAD